MTEALNNIADNWFNWELAILWQVAVLIAIVWMIDLLIRKWAWPQVRYALWLLILVKLILPPTLTSPTSFTAEIPFLAQKAINVQIDQPETMTEIVNVSKSAEPLVTLPENVTHYEEISAEPVPSNVAIQPIEAVPAAVSLSWKAYAFFIWLVGVVILASWLIIRLSNLRREHLKSEQQANLPDRFKELLESTARKLNLKKVPQVILTNKVCCPAVFGVFRPVLLMPADKLKNLTRQDAEHILLHELAHIKRGDLLIHAIHMILQIAYWLNPLLWLIRKQLQNLRELCCDATVAKILKEKTFSYRETLLKTARQLLAEPVDPGLGLLGLFENSNWLVERLKWLERKTWKNRGLRIASIFVLVCLMATCVIPMAKFDPGLPGLTIKGRVTDTATGEPIAGARIYDDPYGPGPDWQKIERGFYAPNLPQWGAITDANGEYAFLTWHEHHSFKVEAKGYEPDRGTLYSSHFSIPTKDIEVFDFALKKGEGETDVEVNAVVGGVDSSDSIGRVNLPVGTRGVVTGKHGDAIYGSDIKYSPLMYLGRVNKDQGIELVDRNIYYSQHTIPIVKVRVLNKLYAAVSVGTVGWVSLACTDFYKAFEQKSDGELPGRFKELKKERRKGTVSSAQDHLSSKVSKKLVEVFGEQERGERSEVSLDDDVVTGDGNIDDSIGKINKPTGTNGVVVSEYGSTMFGSDIKYSSLMHLGDVRKGQRIELVDSKVYYNQFTIPIVKVKVLNKLYASVPVGTAGWVTLADTDFYKWFMQKSDEELPSHFKKLKKERKKRSLALAEERRAKKASSGEPVEVLEVGQDGQSGAEYKAALPNGAVVELVGVCEHPSESKQWWKPDGELIDLPYEVGGKIIGPSEGYQMLDLIAEITTKEQNPAVKFITPGAIRSSTGRNVVINQMNVSDLWSYRFKIDSILKTADVKAGVASGEWKTISTIISSFKNLQRNDTDLGQVEWLKAIEENDEVIIYASNNFSDKAQFRIVAEDVIGRIYPAYTSDCKGNAGLMSCEYKFHLSPKKAKKFLFQTRPYEWTEFKNVSLKPNFKTDVQIEGE